MKLTRQAYPKADMKLLDTLAVDYFIDGFDDTEIRLMLRQSQQETITQAGTLAIRLETFKTADKVKHRTVCSYSEQNESVHVGKSTDVGNQVMPFLENCMTKISSDVESVKSKIDSNKSDRIYGNGKKYFKPKYNDKRQNNKNPFVKIKMTNKGMISLVTR